MRLAQDDEMIQTLAPDRSDQSFGKAILPRWRWCDGFVSNAHGVQSACNDGAIDLIPIVAHWGASAEELAKLRRDNVGFVFQTYHLFPTLNATDNVRLALDVRGERTKAAVVKAKDALTNVGLSHKVASSRLMPFADRAIYLEDGRIIRKEKKSASHQ
jgi:energy-coupling factor transporter ATP-binding protein EcfA2